MSGWGLDEAPPGPRGPGLLGQLPIGRILGSVAQSFIASRQPPSPLDVLRFQYLSTQLQMLQNGGILAFGVAEWSSLFDANERKDYVIVGARGRGKTALACHLAQEFQRVGRPVFALNFSDQAAKSLGFQACREWTSKKDCAVLIDESRLQVGRGKPDEAMFRAIALARHNDVALIWTSQTLGSISLDTLRQEAVLLAKYIDPFSARFEREEARDVVLGAVAVQAKIDAARNPAATLLWNGTTWIGTATPLPAGWTPEVSRLWR